MSLEWTRPALSDLKEAGDFIALDSPQSAERMAGRVKEAGLNRGRVHIFLE